MDGVRSTTTMMMDRNEALLSSSLGVQLRGRRWLNDSNNTETNNEDCYERSASLTDYNEDLSIAPVSGLMFYVTAREKDLRLDALEVDIRWDLLATTEESITVQLYACARCAPNVNFDANGDFAQADLWDLVAQAPLVRHATNAERWLLPGHAFTSPLAIPRRTRRALYLRATDTATGTNRAILDVTNTPLVLSPHDVAYTLPNLQVLGGFGWTEIDPNSDTAVFPSALPSSTTSTNPPIFAGQLYLNAASTFCDFARTLEVAVDFRTVIDTSPRNGNANVTAAEGNIQTVQDFEVTQVQELLQKWAESVLQDDLDLFIWTQKHALVLDRNVQVEYSVYQQDDVACLVPEQCLGVVVKTFWKHTDDLESGWIQAQLYKHTAVVLSIIHNQFPPEMPKFNVGLTGIQAQLAVTLTPVDPNNAVGASDGALVNQAQFSFLEQRFQAHWETTLPNYLENVYTVTLRDASMNGNQLRLAGYVQGSQYALADRLEYATAIQKALNENAETFWETVVFDRGLPAPLAGQAASMDTGLTADQVALFESVDTVSASVDSEFFGIAIRWVDGRGPGSDGSGESDGGGNFGIIVGVVVAALFVIVVLICAARHLDKIQEKLFGKEKNLGDDYGDDDDENTLSKDRFKDEGSRSRGYRGGDSISMQSSIRSESTDGLHARTKDSTDSEEQAPPPRRRSKKYSKYWGGDGDEEVEADDGYDAQYDSRYQHDMMAKMPGRAPPTAVIVGGPMEEADDYDIPRRAINANTQILRPETMRQDEKSRKSTSSKKSKKSSTKDGEKKKSKKSKKSSGSKKSSSKKSSKEDTSE